ncbi:MAG: RAD55 family ATPase, partial [Candidatus Aenigmatarchaeota archaeon]
KIKESAMDFGWDFEKYEDKGQLLIKHKDPFSAEEGEELFWFRNELEEKDIDRVALDSTSVLSLYYENPYEIRKNLFQLVSMIEKQGVTALLTTESEKGEEKLTRFGVEEFLVDGVIELDFTLVGADSGRHLAVRKMRRTDFKEEKFPIDIDGEGITVMSL